MSGRRDFLPPRGRRLSWLAIGVSLGLHSLLLLVKVGSWLPPREPHQRIILVPLGPEGPRAVEMVFRDPTAGGSPRRPATRGAARAPAAESGRPIEIPPPQLDTVPLAVTEPGEDSLDIPPGPPANRGRTSIRPEQGDGSLWVRPLPLPPRDLARAVTRTHAELVDSAVTVIVQAYIDSVLSTVPSNEPLPRWTTRVGEQQLGLDAQWIYLGPIKIPTALVAGLLNAVGGLPVGSSAEMSDFTKFSALRRMREDVQIAARRAQTMEDFKRAIRDLRAQREREREFARNQRTRPDRPIDTTAPPAPIP